MRRIPIFLLLFASWLGCSRDINNKEAVKQAVIDHLSSRKGLDLDLSSMDVDVSSVSFKAGEAEAQVSFRPRGSQNASAAMEMRYTLERAGSQWKVKGKGSSGAGDPHGSAPPQAAPHGTELPGAPQALPPGHPPVAPGEGKKGEGKK